MLLHIDGTDEAGNWVSGLRRAPYAIFDEDAQRNLVINIPFYWLANLLRKRILSKMETQNAR